MKGGRTFTKDERIVSRKQIDGLFAGDGSQSRAAFPLRAVFTVNKRAGAMPPAQVLISVPKRRFRHAVDRNRVKRQIREAYRLNKQLLTAAMPADKSASIAFIWLSSKHLPSAGIEERVRSILTQIAQHIIS